MCACLYLCRSGWSWSPVLKLELPSHPVEAYWKLPCTETPSDTTLHTHTHTLHSITVALILSAQSNHTSNVLHHFWSNVFESAGVLGIFSGFMKSVLLKLTLGLEYNNNHKQTTMLMIFMLNTTSVKPNRCLFVKYVLENGCGIFYNKWFLCDFSTQIHFESPKYRKHH